MDGVGITLSRYTHPEAQPWHFHEHLNVSLLLDGTFVDDSRELGQQPLKPLDMVVHPQGALHRSCPSGPGRLSLNLEPMVGWLEQHGFSRVEYRVSSVPELGIAAFQYLLGNESNMSDALLESLCPPDGQAETGYWFERVEDLIGQREDWTLSGLADALGVHPVYFARVFRARRGQSVTSFLRERRLVRAANCLVRARSTGSEIATRFGYSDEAHFSRHFRTVFGMSPTSAKKRFQIFNLN